MNKGLLLFTLLLLGSLAFAEPLEVVVYHQVGCPACAITFETLDSLSNEYDLNLIEKEIANIPENFNEMKIIYEDFGYCVLGGKTPSTVINNQTLIIGSLPADKWKELFDACLDGNCKKGTYEGSSFTPKSEDGCENNEQPLTLTILIGAAIIDSINPCTIAVMVMLLGVILLTQGRERTLMAGILFTITIFTMYLLMGLGLLTAVASSEFTNLFFMIVTVMALALAIMEINAYFNYKPGFLSVEMPMFLRPYLKTAMKKAISLPGVVVVAVICSLFLLPCSSGPYLLVLGMLSKAITVQALMYLVLYNFIFILPMLIIVIAVYKGMTTVEDMTELRNKYIKELHLVSGIILFLLFLLMLAKLLGYL